MAITRKLIYSESQKAVKPNDIVDVPKLGSVIVKNVRAPRKESGTGRVTLLLSDGRKVDYPPSIINATWI